MDLKAWKIAGIICVLCSLAPIAVILYHAAWLGNPKVMSNIGREPLKLFLMLLQMNALLAALITFPYYWYTVLTRFGRLAAIRRMPRSASALQEQGRLLLGFAASCACGLLALFLKQF